MVTILWVVGSQKWPRCEQTMVILYFFCFPANFDVSGVLLLLFSFSEVKVLQIHRIFFDTLYTRSRGGSQNVPIQNPFYSSQSNRPCVQYLLVYLFPELFGISSLRALSACHFFHRSYASFQTSKMNLGAIQMVRKSINRSHAVHVMRYQSIYNLSLAPPAPSLT